MDESSIGHGEASHRGKENTLHFSSHCPPRSAFLYGSPFSFYSTESNTASNNSSPLENKRALAFTFVPKDTFRNLQMDESSVGHGKFLNDHLNVFDANAELCLSGRDQEKRLIHAAMENNDVSGSLLIQQNKELFGYCEDTFIWNGKQITSSMFFPRSISSLSSNCSPESKTAPNSSTPDENEQAPTCTFAWGVHEVLQEQITSSMPQLPLRSFDSAIEV